MDWRLDRPGRPLCQLIESISELNRCGVDFKSLIEQIDTTSSGGRLIFQVFGALAQRERELNRERAQARLAAAVAQALVPKIFL